MSKANGEQKMWEKEPRVRVDRLTDDAINNKYDRKSERIVTETNREKLQNFYEALSRPGYMDIRPTYQRRSRWDNERQSKLIESLLINIPIPPLFVYENKPNYYEVMDGQQRISAIKAFYSNELVLKGLDRWPELNGRTYSKLPERIKSGIDRRSITWIAVLHESADTEEEALVLKQLVFERLNTGGVALSPQEIRNSLYQGPFNDLLFLLGRNNLFRAPWNIAPFTENEIKQTPDELLDNRFYLQMEDLELILRFFALRHVEHYQRGMQGFLDLYMLRARMFDERDISFLKRLFEGTINLASSIYKDNLFITFNSRLDSWGTRPQKAYADAVLVALSDFVNIRDNSANESFTLDGQILIDNSASIISATIKMFTEDTDGVLSGRGNTKKDVESRIVLLSNLYRNVLHKAK